MKSMVIYYSMTGNTKIIAQALQKGISRRTGQCDIARLKDIKPEEWVNYDLIGIGSPVWGGELTPMFMDYVKVLPPTVKGKHAFFYCTHGVLPARCIIIGVKQLQEQGLTVIGWKDWYSGCVPLPGHAKPWFSDGHPDEIDIAEAESFGTAMAEHSWKISQGATDMIPTLPSPEASDEFYGVFFPSDMIFEKQPDGESSPQFRVTWRINAEKCTGCGLCAEACFYDIIDAFVIPPVFKSQDCCGCGFCEGICPAGAIESDAPRLNLKAVDLTRNREHMRNTLNIAEAKGRFRRLVREEDMDWDIPWEEASGGPPRFKEIP